MITIMLITEITRKKRTLKVLHDHHDDNNDHDDHDDDDIDDDCIHHSPEEDYQCIYNNHDNYLDDRKS